MKHWFHRQDRVEADLRCLMCSRLIGQLYGLVRRDTDGRGAALAPAHMTEFRPSIAGAPTTPVTGRAQIRCRDCGGIGVVDEIRVTHVVESLQAQDWCPIHGEGARRRGRPPRGCKCDHLRRAA
jgi:hypothetical protein